MTVTDGELQISLDAGDTKMRRSILEMSHARLQGVFAWTRELGVPVLPLSAAEEPVDQVHRLLGQLPLAGRHAGRGQAWGPVHG